MRRPSFGTVVLSCVTAVLFFAVPASMQGPPSAEVDMVNGHEAVAREVLVRLRRPAQAADLEELRAQADGLAIEEIGRAGALRLRSRSMDAASLVSLLSQRGDVLYVEPNYIVRAFTNDARFPQLWGLENIGQTVNGLPGVAGADIRAVPAWDITTGSTDHVVAVIDTGIDYNHPDLAPNMWSAPARFTVDLGNGRNVTCAAGTHGFNAITRTCNPMDDHSHGTHVAGTIGAAGNNGIGVVGVNWTTQLMGIKFLDDQGSGSIAGAIDAIRFAIEARRTFQGAADVRVLSNSWGGTEFSQALLDEIRATQDEDMLFVAAAGNSASNNDLIPTYPASYDSPNIVAVAATTNTDGRAYFSNYGAASVHLGAPGYDILSTTPNNNYAYFSGTSMAAPHVSGAAALVLSRCALDTAALKDALVGTVRPIGALASVTITGGGLDVNSAVHSCIAPPDAPADLTAIGADTQVRLSWSPALGATGYTVKRSVTPGGPYAAIASDVKGAQYTDADVVNGTTYYYVVSAANSLGTSGDSNEASATPNRPSDLVVSALTAPGTASAGSTIAVSVTTTNQGGGPAAASTTRIYLSTNSGFDTSDLPLEPAQAVPALEPGASSPASLTVAIPSDTAPGVRYLIAVADSEHVVNETLVANNTRVRSLVIGPDLTISAFSAPLTAAAGEAISVSDTVKNQGAGAAAPSGTNFYLSVNSSLDASDTLLEGARAVPALEAGASSAGASTVTIPSTTAVGSYYLLAKADGGSVVSESVETNNTSPRLIRIGVDLVVSAFSAPTAGGPGLAVTVTDTTTNQGTGGADSTVTRFFLSTTTQLDSTDTELGSRVVPSLAAGASSSATTTLTIPATTSAGSYYLLAVADANHTVPETLESNNQLARLIQVGGDLRVSAFTVPTSAGPGSSVVVTDTTSNQGGGAIGATTTRYYFSANTLLDAQDQALGSRGVPDLSAGGSHSGSATVTIPNVATGTYYIIAKADADDAVSETQETNNTYARSLQIGGDLAISAFSVPYRSGAGLTIVVSDTTVNGGSALVPPSMTRFYLSNNSALDANDTLLPGGRSVPELAAGASSSGSTSLTIPTTAQGGLYYVFAKADADGAIGETMEGNNTFARSIQIGPDLTVSALTVPGKVEAGSTISVTDTTTNLGGGGASSSATAFFLSVNAALDSGDIALDGSHVMNALAAGASSSATTSLTIPANITPGVYFVIAKADANASVIECQEGNNTRAQATWIGPDLAVSSASLPISTVQAGATGTVSDTVVNQGAGLATPSTVGYYLSVNSTLDGADVLLSGSRAVPQLATNATSSGSTVITIPAGTAPGTYWVLAKGDADNVVAESVESNNVRLVRNIQVTAP